MDYQIATGYGPSELALKVNELLDRGWKPAGGVAVEPAAEGYAALYSQALTSTKESREAAARARELVSLRNAVGMMSEARRADAAEYDDMRAANRELRADALRLRWLAEDHADPELRQRVRAICQSIPTRSLRGVRLDIDANMRA